MSLTAYPDVAVDREQLIARIHALQVDLTLLAGWLASESSPALSETAIWIISNASHDLQSNTKPLTGLFLLG